jgi:hypothetical protein
VAKPSLRITKYLRALHLQIQSTADQKDLKKNCICAEHVQTLLSLCLSLSLSLSLLLVLGFELRALCLRQVLYRFSHTPQVPGVSFYDLDLL